jgi:glucose-1-phosphate adenylyltransferase
MNYMSFLEYHEENNADLTISLLEVPVETADQYGVAEVKDDFRIFSFQEKPESNIKTIPGDPRHVLASMGIYLFRTKTLLEILNKGKENDFGKEIIPNLLDRYRVFAYAYGRQNHIQDFIYSTLDSGERQKKLEPHTRDSSYWRDVGTLDSYWNANMDLTGVDPFFNLYGRLWPIHTYQKPNPPAKFIFANESSKDHRVGKALDSLVSPGCIISGIVRDCILGNNVTIRSWANVEESVVLDNVTVGRSSKIKKAIIDKNNNIPDKTRIGYDPKEDRDRFTVTPRGIVVVPKGYFPYQE